MDDDLDYTPRPRTSRQLRWQHLAAVLVSGAGIIIEDIADTIEGVAKLLMFDGNYAEDRLSFHEGAALELESLMEGDE